MANSFLLASVVQTCPCTFCTCSNMYLLKQHFEIFGCHVLLLFYCLLGYMYINVVDIVIIGLRLYSMLLLYT